MSSITTFSVSGLTCSHCVGAVSKELRALPGVTGVTIDLVAGGVSPVTVTSDVPLTDADIEAAVDEAGYELVDAG